MEINPSLLQAEEAGGVAVSTGVSADALARMRAAAERILSRVRALPKTIMEQDVPGIVELVGEGVSKVALLRKIRLTSARGGSSEARAVQRTMGDIITALVRGLSEVPLPTTREGRKLGDVLTHYRACELADDTTLAKDFERIRSEYQANPTDAETCVRFGWLLHDCLQAAYGRLRNVKLVQFFKSEFEKWRYGGDEKDRDMRLDAVRASDLLKADAFLSGPHEAMECFASGDWDKAILACKSYLDQNPGNGLALKTLVAACEKSKAESAVFDMLNACEEGMKWFPDESAYQIGFVRAATRAHMALCEKGQRGEAEKFPLMFRLSKAKEHNWRALAEHLSLVFPRMASVMPGTSDYSSLLWTKTAAVDRVLAAHFLSADQKSAAALDYVDFVAKWGVRNFRKEDFSSYVGTRKRESLVTRVAVLLVKCGLHGVPHTSDSWQMKFVASVGKVFNADPSRYLRAMVMVCMNDGDFLAARRYALDLVRGNQTESWRWYLLAQTFPKDSGDANDCRERAASLQRRETSADAEVEAACRRADELLLKDAVTSPGVILSWFTDVPTGNEVIRVWWKDAAKESGEMDFVELSAVSGLDRSPAGTPVCVSHHVVNGREKVVCLGPRTEGNAWDVYPLIKGVVSERMDSRRFLKVAYAKGRFCSVDLRKHPAAVALQRGEACELAVLERAGMSSLVLMARGIQFPDKGFPWCKAYRGELARARASRDGLVDDVRVVPAVRDGIAFKTRVGGLAVDVGPADSACWVAVTCQSISNDLEVLQ